MTKVIIQIPCLNEAETLGIALQALPRTIAGVDEVEWLIIDDGSTDDTVKVAREYGVDHIIQHPVNKGLASAFMTGITACLTRGADIIINTDADNQYNADDIPKLVEPILARRAEMVIGARPISSIEHFSPIKKILQKVGSYTVRVASGTNIPDAPSGFRAISRRAALQLIVHDKYTYTIDTIIQSRSKNIEVTSVPIRVNGDLRPSRLVKSITDYVNRSIKTILHIFTIYHPLRFFWALSALFFIPGFILGLRFLYYFTLGHGDGKIQSLILASLLVTISVVTLAIGVMAHLVTINRRVIEDVRGRLLDLQSRFDHQLETENKSFRK